MGASKGLLKLLIIGILIGIVVAIPFALRLFYSDGLAGVTGKAASSVFIASGNLSTCQIDMIPGWNLISIHCDDDNMSVSNVFSTIQGNYSSVHAYDRYDPTDKWKAYKPGLPSWVISDLQTLSTKQGYWIEMTAADSLIFNGTVKYPTLIFLFEGWNLVGYPSDKLRLVNETFLDVMMNLNSVHLYNVNDTSDPWKVYSTSVNTSENDLVYMLPGFGYWVRMDDRDTWMVDE